MSKLSARMAVPVAILMLAGAVALSRASSASAYLNGDGPTNIIQKLVEKFNLNEDEVKAVFDEVRAQERAERQAEHISTLEEKLSEAVASGDLTEAQKQLVLDKHEEIMAEREALMESWKDLSDEDRQAKMEEHKAQMSALKEELKAWAESNDIDLKYVMGPGGRGEGGFGRHGQMRLE